MTSEEEHAFCAKPESQDTQGLARRLAQLTAEVAAMPVADDRTPEEIIGYDDDGLSA